MKVKNSEIGDKTNSKILASSDFSKGVLPIVLDMLV